MIASGYVWIATDWLAAALDSTRPPNPKAVSLVQGVVTLRQYTQDSGAKRSLTSRFAAVQQLILLVAHGDHTCESIATSMRG